MSRLLVCPPDHYRIAYEINPWMHLEGQADPTVARVQWDALTAILEKECGVTLERMVPVAGLPDLVFTANGGVVMGRTAVLSRFRHPERRPEEPHFERWFRERGYQVEHLPEGIFFEGAGDFLGFEDVWFGGYRQRTDLRAYQFVGAFVGRRILPIELVDPRFYHLDTCFCPLSGGELIWFPPAFDRYGKAVIMDWVEGPRRIAVPEEEAVRFACNAVCVGRHVVLPEGCPVTMERLESFGYAPHAVGLSEFIKSGGAAKCLTLALD